jgi:hypothetical protein
LSSTANNRVLHQHVNRKKLEVVAGCVPELRRVILVGKELLVILEPNEMLFEIEPRVVQGQPQRIDQWIDHEQRIDQSRRGQKRHDVPGEQFSRAFDLSCTYGWAHAVQLLQFGS